MRSDVSSQIKSFGMTNQMISEDLTSIGTRFGIKLGHIPPAVETVEKDYYPQLAADVRAKGARMARHYEVFYSLEKSIRSLVSETLASEHKTDDWWHSSKVPENLRIEVSQRIKREIDAGVSRRSQDEIDYTIFGELSVLISVNWTLVGSIFNSKKAVERVFANLNA